MERKEMHLPYWERKAYRAYKEIKVLQPKLETPIQAYINCKIDEQEKRLVSGAMELKKNLKAIDELPHNGIMSDMIKFTHNNRTLTSNRGLQRSEQPIGWASFESLSLKDMNKQGAVPMNRSIRQATACSETNIHFTQFPDPRMAVTGFDSKAARRFQDTNSSSTNMQGGAGGNRAQTAKYAQKNINALQRSQQAKTAPATKRVARNYGN